MEHRKEYSIPKSHPRYESLRLREIIADAVEDGLTAPEGLIAHGRGEAFDYLLGECTQPPAKAAIDVAAAALVLAENPVLSVNGNVAALAPEEIIRLSKIIPAKIEVNIFHYSKERFDKILNKFHALGAEDVLGAERDKLIPGLEHARAACTGEGIYTADVVLVPLEDGDRARALRAMGKTVITIDLNPLSRTAMVSSITIVDNLVRALPELIQVVEKFKGFEKNELEMIRDSFNNTDNLKDILKIINQRLSDIEF
ncbi:4-phosphopantoate--beta-alanine ligase [[Eubacterium] cellulosolvens]